MLKKTGVLFVLLGGALLLLWLTGRSASFEVQEQRMLAHPEDAVWRTLTDVAAWPRWWPGMERAALVSDWTLGAALDLALTGDSASAPARIEMFQPGRELGWSRTGVLGSMSWTTLRVAGRNAGTLVVITTGVRGPQAILARITGRAAFADYQRRVLAGLGEQVARSAVPEWAGERRDER